MKIASLRTVLLVGILSIVMGILSAAGAQEQPAEQNWTLRYAENNQANDSITLAAKELARLVDERSGGRIKIEVYAGGQLGGHANVIQSIQAGTLEMGRTQFGYLADAGLKKLAVFSLPFMFSGIDHARATMHGTVGSSMLEEIKKDVGVIGLGYLVTYPRHFFFRSKDVQSLKDMKGLRLRVQPGALYVEMVQAFGASATPIDFGELYTALQTGVVDGAEQPLKGFVNNQFPEVAKVLTLTAHQIDPSIVMISPTVWNKMSDADKKLLQDAFNDAETYYREIAAKEEEAAFEKVRAAGVTIREVDHAEWQAAVGGVYKKYAEFSSLIEAIQKVK
jgi:tripartite ATP-independent transporter DctP family solute receptor